jgi:hypothetical protein
MLAGRWNVENQAKAIAWFFALSAHYAKATGADIVLHTDALGERLLSHLPYDNIYRTLDRNRAHERFWASGKIIAQEAEPLGSVHIDGDVFIKSGCLYDRLLSEDYDLIVQAQENCGFDYARSPYKAVGDLIFPLAERFALTEFNANQPDAYNCGVVGFKNAALKKAYIDGYYKMLNVLQNNAQAMSGLRRESDLCPDLIAEQWWLKTCADYYKAKVSCVLDYGYGADYTQRQAIERGYTHVIGKEKYSQVDKVKERLLEVDPVLYAATAAVLNGIKI